MLVTLLTCVVIIARHALIVCLTVIFEKYAKFFYILLL